MKVSAIFPTVVIFLGAEALAERCSTSSPAPCECPPGFDYSQPVSFAVVGAHARAVAEGMTDYFNPAWRGAFPYDTIGPNNSPGQSIRTTTFNTLQGTFNISEILTDQIIQDNGSFIQKFEYFPVDKECSDQNSASVETPFSGGGGYWITIAGDYIFGNETLIRWSTYICSKGFVADFNASHEKSFKNVMDMLAQQGKIAGGNVNPFSI